jgi:hypothetical protein
MGLTQNVQEKAKKNAIKVYLSSYLIKKKAYSTSKSKVILVQNNIFLCKAILRMGNKTVQHINT